jgi:4-amino-4-deoxy-L-arabinose transferase-like glycosyltransferase
LWDVRGPDEGRYTQIGRELLHRHNWMVLTVQGHPYDQKPPLAFWFFALAMKVAGGVSTWALRMPGILAALGSIALTYQIALRRWGTGAAFFAGLFLLASPAFIDDAPAIELNMLYTFFTTAALAVWLLFEYPAPAVSPVQKMPWLRAELFWLCAAAAFFVKGPLSILVIFSAIGFACWSQKSAKPLKSVRPVVGFIALIVLIALWQYAQRQAFGSQFVEKQVTGETVNRFLAGTHHEAWWYYFPRFFTTIFVPWGLLLAAALYVLFRRRQILSPAMAPLIGWVALPFLVLVLANGKRVSYMLPLLPACALVSGWYMDSAVARMKLSRWAEWLLILPGGLIAGALVALGVTFLVKPAFLVRPDVALGAFHAPIWILSGIAAAAMTAFFARRPSTVKGAWLLAGLILILHFTEFAGLRPGLDPRKSARPFAEAVQGILDTKQENAIITIPDLAEPEYHVYGNYQVVGRPKSRIHVSDPSIPNLLVLPVKDAKSSETELTSAGWQEKMKLYATNEPVMIFTRMAPSASPAEPAAETKVPADAKSSTTQTDSHV